MLVEVQTIGLKTFTVEIGEAELVPDFRRKVAVTLRREAATVKLISGGRVVTDADSAEVLSSGPILAVAQPSGLRGASLGALQRSEGVETDPDAEEQQLQLPATASQRTRKAVKFLVHKFHIPEFILILLLQVRGRIWLGLAAWIVLAPLAAKLEIGELYVLGTIAALIFLNLGRRKEGEASAYSIFNGFRALPGQLTADELDRQVRTGQM